MPEEAATTKLVARQRDRRPSSEGPVAPLSETLAACGALAGADAEGARTVLACEPTSEGVLSAVGATYLAHADPARLRLAGASALQPALGERVVHVPVDEGLALRVFDGLEQRCTRGCPKARRGRCAGGCSGACVRRVAFACASDDPAMPDVVLRYVRLAFEEGPRVGDLISHPAVATMADLARSVANECEHTRQFVRFSRLEDGTFRSVFRPAADTLPLTAGYFSARMGTERFYMVDPVHRTAVLHEPGRRAQVTRLDETLAAELAEQGDLAEDERYVRAMWHALYDALELEGRDAFCRGYDLRMSWMPKRFWAGLPEMGPESASYEGEIPARYAGDGRPTPERSGQLNLKMPRTSS
jgi:probable DNA metabolism protein